MVPSKTTLDTVGDSLFASVSEYAQYSVPAKLAALGHVVMCNNNRPGGIDNSKARTDTHTPPQPAA